MIEFFGVFAIGILVGILGTLMILRGLRGDLLNIDEDIDEEEFEELEEVLFSHTPEEDEIELPEQSGLRIPTGKDIIEHEKEMEELFNGIKTEQEISNIETEETKK